MTEGPASVDRDQSDPTWLPMTWSRPAATLCQAVDQLIIEPNEAGLIISFVEVGRHRSPPLAPTLITSNCIAQVAVSPDNLLALMKLRQKAYPGQLARKIRIVKTCCF